MKFSLLSLAAIVPLAAAHFKLNYPPSRGFDEDNMPEFPCGGFAQSDNRTKLSISAGTVPVALTLGHSQTVVEILLALGNNPGDNYNITLAHTFHVTGLGSFCLPGVSLNESALGVPLTDGLNATLQVVTDGDTGGGLYACADVTFTSTLTSDDVSASVCANNTGVSATPLSGAAALRHANESTAEGEAQSGSSSSNTSTTSSASSTSSATNAASTSTSKGAAVPLETAAWGIIGAAVIGGLAAL